MLSILIPCYNYNCFPLVEELHKQADILDFTFEIICIDDASNSVLNKHNAKINELPNASFKVLDKNLGRSAIRNYLVKQSNYNQLLFLDADVLPKNSSFLKTVFQNIDKEVVFGGIECSIKRPKENSILRWKYSLKRECKQLKQRNNNSYFSFTSACFSIQKKIFDRIKFDESLKKYGCEDVLFAYDLKQHNITITHIENPVYHDNIESSTIFVEKTQLALSNLRYLVSQEKLPTKAYNVTKIHSFIQRVHISYLLNLIFKITKKTILKNLCSKRPSLFLFDFYKLGYFNSITKNNA